MRTADSEKNLMLGKMQGRRRGWQRMRWLERISDSMDMSWNNSGKWWRTVKPGTLQSIGAQIVTWLSDWTTTEAGPEQRSNSMWFILEGSEMLAGQWHRDTGGGRQRGVWYILSNHREQPEYHSSKNTREVVNNACPRNIPAKAWGGWATYPTPSSYWLGPPSSVA